jgi:anti-sigma regulatory factor (Ser/Thr protein kinase)
LSETLWLQPNALAPGRARRWLAEWCVHWGCTDIEDDAALLVSELITNATLHARTTITVSARFEGNQLRVAVADRQPGLLRAALPAGSAESGRGLPVVEALATKWGVHNHRGGKFVWFTLTSGLGTAPALAARGVAGRAERAARFTALG